MSQSTQMGSFIPPQLWRTENAPMAAMLRDPDSMHDAFLMTSYTHAAAPELGISVLTDGLRIGPAQLTQMLLTLADMAQGRMVVHVGGGEVKQTGPFGYKRSRGIKSLEDFARIFDAFLTSDGPFDYEGNHWQMKQAFLGSARAHRPRIHAMGSGPMLLDVATSYCDGLSSAAPCAWGTPEEAAEVIAQVRKDVERKGRDPEAFTFGIFCPVLIHEDENVLDKALDNPIVRWIAATFGRIQGSDWAKAGLPSPTPEGWAYFKDFLPKATPTAFIDDVLSKTTRAHAEVGYLWGTPQQVADKLLAYAEAGVSFVAPADYLPVVCDPEDAALGLDRSIACLGAVKGG
ncbi:LLM class flavin-dependent oxidoreductase [Sporichthya polymorpha]|uniref:LLM class flavin-dependent oxidoreductase n=1 Tax=Sporichthya polymorpha TaxID=35751 RepID=UPI00146CF1B9|nr:LLM class flavin-dependent oxidoreductase [Sporichthya polymorpha]